MGEQLKTERKRCISKTKDGKPCKAAAITPAGYCWMHDTSLVAQQNAARAKGGKNSSKIARLRGLVPPRLIEVYDKLEAALEEVHDGKLTPGQAMAMAAIARAMVAVLTAGELEERVRDLEQKQEGN